LENLLHYRILEKLGQGGMGVVYKAKDTKLKREGAIKFLPRQISASASERERFEHEAQAAAALNHPSIATIHAIEDPSKKATSVILARVPWSLRSQDCPRWARMRYPGRCGGEWRVHGSHRDAERRAHVEVGVVKIG